MNDLLKLDEERLQLTREIEKINIQLSDNNRINPETQERLTGRAYADWRKSAQVAKSHMLERLREVNHELKKLGRDLGESKQDTVIGLLEQLLLETKRTNELLAEEYEEV